MQRLWFSLLWASRSFAVQRVPLSTYFSALYNDFLVISSSETFLDDSYAFTAENSFVFAAAQPNTLPLQRYRRAADNHTYVTASVRGNAFALFCARRGGCAPPPRLARGLWKCGIVPRATTTC